jgi:hypothetical protein
VSGQLHAPAALPPGKSPRYPFYRRLGGPQSRSGRYGEVKNFYPSGTWTPAPLVVQLVASRYTDWANPLFSIKINVKLIMAQKHLGDLAEFTITMSALRGKAWKLTKCQTLPLFCRLNVFTIRKNYVPTSTKRVCPAPDSNIDTDWPI